MKVPITLSDPSSSILTIVISKSYLEEYESLTSVDISKAITISPEKIKIPIGTKETSFTITPLTNLIIPPINLTFTLQKNTLSTIHTLSPTSKIVTFSKSARRTQITPPPLTITVANNLINFYKSSIGSKTFNIKNNELSDLSTYSPQILSLK